MPPSMRNLSAIALLVASGAVSADAFPPKVTLGATASIFGFGPSLSWRFHENLGVTARYTDGLSLSGSYNSDNMTYDGDPELGSASFTLDYFPTGESFYLTAGAMRPDVGAQVAAERMFGFYNVNGTPYSAAEVGELDGELTFSDGVYPYLGIGWRHSHRSGFGFFSEIGLISMDVDVSLRSSSGLEDRNAEFRRDLRAEEESLKGDVDHLPVLPMGFIGVSYTF